MHRSITVGLCICAVVGCATASRSLPAVDTRGQHPKIKLSHLVSGYLSELNGKYQLRVSEVTYDPGGYIGPHHHLGPGIRCITSGALTYVEHDVATIYRPGDCFFESGDMVHTARNNTQEPVVLLNFEILPASLKGGSTIPVPEGR